MCGARWFLTGMSGFFVDPMFSSNSAAIASNNRYIVSLIQANEEGRRDLFRNRVRHFNIKMRNLYLRQKLGFANYSFFGSFDAFSNWQTLRYHSILNYSVPLQHADLAPVIQAVDSHSEKECGCEEGVWSPFQSLGNAGDRLTREFEQIIREHDSYHQRNRFHFHDKTEREATRRKTIELDFGPAVEEESRLNWRCFVRYYLHRACQMKALPFFESRFDQHFVPCWESGQTLSELLDFMKLGPLEVGERPAGEWGFKGPHCQVQAVESAF